MPASVVLSSLEVVCIGECDLSTSGRWGASEPAPTVRGFSAREGGRVFALRGSADAALPPWTMSLADLPTWR